MVITVTGIPKHACSSSYVFHLFQRVAQVRRVQFDADKGQAKVFFFDKFFERNILEMNWSINGSKLSLSQQKFDEDKFQHKCTFEMKKYQTDASTSESMYDKYKKGISTFWANIPHENSNPRCKNAKKRRRKWEDFTSTDECYQRNKKKQMKKRKNLTKKKSQSKNDSTPPSNSLLTEGEHEQQYFNSIQHSSKELSSIIPVYIIHGNKNTLLNLAPEDIPYIKRQIREKLGIPSRLQLLMHRGKLLGQNASVKLEPYDNIHIVIQGRGGMKNEDTERVNAAPEDRGNSNKITNKSTEEEVAEWIKNFVCLPDEVYKKYEDNLSLIDGTLLLSYCNAEKFASDAQLPVGIARKILYVCNTTDDLTKYYLSNESPCEVNEFISRIKKLGLDKERMDHFLRTLVENYIDGFNFRSYRNEEEFSDDFKELGLPKICLRKILQHRDKFFPQITRKQESENNILEKRHECKPDKGAITEPMDSDEPYLQNNFTNTIHDSTFAPSKHLNAHEDLSSKNVQKAGNENLSVNKDNFEYEHPQRFEVLDTQTSGCINTNCSSTTTDKHKGIGDENDIVAGSMEKHSKEEPTKMDMEHINLPSPMPRYLENTTKWQLEDRLSQDINQGNRGSQSEQELTGRSVSQKDKDVSNLKDNLVIKGLLQESKERNECIDCMLKVVIHCDWEKPNDFEKNFIFFVISPSVEFEDNNKRKAELWKAIVKRTPVWRKEIPENVKETISNQEFTKQCKSLKLLLDVNSESLQRYKNACYIFLVSENLHIERTVIYKTPLSRNSKNRHFYFAFPENKHHFLYHPNEMAKGFRRSVLTGDLNFVRSHEEIDNKEDRGSVVEIKENRITESASSIFELKFQTPRKFREDPYSITYKRGHLFSQTEHDGTLTIRCIEYKLFEGAQQYSDRKYVKYLKEVLRFACGCLNKRQNGTLYFGIGDEKNKEGYRTGEVVGFDIFENGVDTRSKYSDALRHAIQNCFLSAEIAKECISNPHFIVTVADENTPEIDTSELFSKVVMEIDIEPSNDMCGDTVFLVDLSKIPNISLTKKIKEKYIMFVREGSSTRSLENEQDKRFFKEVELKTNIKKRNEFEKKQYPKPVIRDNLSSKLKHLVTLGDFSHEFDADNPDSNYICPILVAGKPSYELKRSVDFERDFAFVKHMPFLAVFDFDDFSHTDGLCSYFRVPEQSKFVENKIFQQKTGNLRVLADELNLEYDRKRLWIFANGREDLNIKHLQRREWFSSYYAEISAAISFLSQPFVVPKNRITFLILLLSTDLDGVVDTFSDIVAKFGWDHITIVPNTEFIFREFSDRVVNECKGTHEDLRKHTVIGMPWDHINRTLSQLSNKGDTSDCLVSSSSGTPVTLTERFIDTCTDLKLLGHNECKNIFKNKDEKARKELKRTQLIQFYRGAKVTWWNIFFEDQVCLREDYLDNLEERIDNKLKNPNEANVVVMTIAHEAGAGATTLAHQILWIFRKKQVRCCVLKKITNFTAAQILRYWKVSEDLNPLPILVLVDDLLQSELSYDTFVSNLRVEFRKQSEAHGMLCLILTCQRENAISDSDSTENYNVFKLRHKLKENEKDWFSKKFLELEHQQDMHGYDPRYLISFMIMRSGFNRSLIERTLTYLLYDDNIPIPERECIKYVSFLSAYTPFARRWIKVVIPVECCDRLMTKRFWESRRKSSAFNILLVIEKAEERSEKFVRMGYPAIALDVLKEIMNKENITLKKVAKDFFHYFIDPEMTNGGRIRDYTLAMLKERIRSGKDDKKTNFSKLIENIIESDAVHGLDSAIEVINEGFEIFHDAILAQTLARLYLTQKQFEKAIHWAGESVNFATTQSVSFCLHTYGISLREKFKTNRQNHGPYDLGTGANEQLQLVLESLGKFIEAQDKRDRISSTYEAFHDTIYTINIINEFLRSINHGLKEDAIKKYLIDKAYIPDVVRHVWKNFHEKLKNMKSEGERALDLIEDKICFYSSFDVQDIEMHVKGTRHNADLQNKYKNYLAKFCLYYGEDNLKIDSNAEPYVQDAYHKARLMKLKGHSYQTIFDHIKQIDHGTLKGLTEIRTHINAIKDPTSSDLLNKVCVNVALGIAGGHYSREDDLIAICFNIIERNEEKVNRAYMFLSMLMWPSNKMIATFNEQRFQEALSYLQGTKERPNTSKETVQKVNMFLVTDERISQPSITFFQGKGCGVRSLQHRSNVFMNREVPRTIGLLRMKGIVNTTKNASPFIVVVNEKCKNINIHIFRKKDRELTFGEEVSFFLGFSIAGPVAYDIKHTAFCHS